MTDPKRTGRQPKRDETPEPTEAQRAAARVVVSPGIAQAIRNLPSLAQQLKMLDAGKIVEQVKMAPLIAAQAKAAHALFDSFSRRQRERAERAERELAEKAKADKARRRNGGKKAGKKLQRNAGQGQQAHR